VAGSPPRWHFSFDHYHDPAQMGVGALRVFNDRLQPIFSICVPSLGVGRRLPLIIWEVRRALHQL
jgi:hypothetical protein